MPGLRNTRKILLALVAALGLTVSLTATHVPQAFADATDYVAMVQLSDGSSIALKDFNAAWDYAKSQRGTMILLKDWTTSSALIVDADVSVTIELQGHMINRSNVDPSKPEYGSDSGNDGSVFVLKTSSKLTITSDDSATVHNGDLLSDGRFWHYNKNGATAINGGLITGGATDSKGGGGAFALETSAELDMSNVTVAGNISDCYIKSYGCGGALSLAGASSTAKLTDCSLMYNYAEHGGGAISIMNKDCSLTMAGGCVSSNHTDSYGGGLFIDEPGLNITEGGEVSVSLSTTEVSNNAAGEDGGGIYLGCFTTSITGGKICGNTATKSGGGVYVEMEGCALNGCTITNNQAGTRGGGVLVENDNVITVPALYLSGTLVIKDNQGGGSRENLFLRNSSSLNRAAKIYGTPSNSSEIWITAEEDGVISYSADSYNDAIYYADNATRVVYWETNSADENYRFLKIGVVTKHSKSGVVANKKQLKASETSTGTGNLQTTSYDYNGYPVYKGYSMEDKTDLLNAYYYSDGYFMDSATNYNDHIASFAIHLACAAMNSSIFSDSYENGRDYTLQGCHAKQLLSDIGAEEEDIYISPTFFTKPTSDSIACAIGSKELKNADGSDSGITLVMIGVRGQGYEAEWASNVTIGSYGEHTGFANSADTVLNDWLTPYLEQRGLDEKAKQGNVRFLVSGFSRGGAVSNLLSKRLIDKYEFKSMVGDNHVVFGYTFEAPMGGMYSCMLKDRSYNGIHNVLLSGDLVPFVAMSAMNFQRYGVDHYLAGTEAGTASTDVVSGDGAESEGQAKRYLRKYAGWLSHSVTISDGKYVENTDDWKSTCFMKDNDYYEVGSEEYNSLKSSMLKQLAACNSDKTYDDYFHLATMSLKSDTFTGYVKETGNASVSLTEYLDDFAFYANAWLIGDSTLKNVSARGAYAPIFVIEEVQPSYQGTTRTLLSALMAKEIKTDTVLSRVKNSDTIKDLIKWALGSDVNYSDLAKILANHGVLGDDSLPLSEEQMTTLTYMIDHYLSGDWKNTSEYQAGTSVDYGTDEPLLMTGTLLYNVNRILLNHNPDVVCAWLRCADSYYTSDDEVSTTEYRVASATSEEVEKPYLTMKVNDEEVTVKAGETLNLFDYDRYEQPTVTDIQLHTEDSNAGGMVFYTEGDGKGVEYKNYSYYDINNSTLFDGVTDWSQEQKLTAQTVWYNTPSDNATFTIYYKEKPNVKSVYVNDELFGKFEVGEKVSVPLTPEDDCHEFESCVLANSSQAPSGSWWTLSDDRSTLEITVPDCDTYWQVNYAQKRVATPVASPDITEFESDQYIALSTPSGTEDEGFAVSCSYRAYTTDNVSDKKEISGTGSGGCVVSAIDGRETTWIIDATAKHDGWVESTKQFIVHVKPVEKTYTVEVLNGTLVTDGKVTDETFAAFKAGDTVTVTAASDKIDGWESEPADLVDSACKETTISFTMPQKNVAISAILTEDSVTEHTVTFDTAGGSEVDAQTVADGATAEEPDAPTLDGFKFEGWYLEDGTAYDFSSAVTADLTLYAHWSASGEVVPLLTVTFDTAGGSEIDSQTVAEGACVAEPAEPVRDGFTFEGWCLEDGSIYDFTTPVTTSITLHAKWAAVDKDSPTFTVTFDTAGGSSVDAQKVVDGGLATEPAAPTRDGFTFEGWYLEDGTAYDYATPITADITLYAKWSAVDEPDDKDDDPADGADDKGDDSTDESDNKEDVSSDKSEEPKKAEKKSDSAVSKSSVASSKEELAATGDGSTTAIFLLTTGAVLLTTAAYLHRRSA